MGAKLIQIAGEPYLARPFRAGEQPAPGMVLRDRYGVNVFRYLCDDGAEAVLRNVRRTDRFLACDASSLGRDYLVVEGA